MEQVPCPKCKTITLPNYNFCPSCGSKLKNVVDVTVGKQIILYLMSFLLPPLGLLPGIRYLKNPDEKAKHIGLIMIFITVFSSIISIWVYIGFINNFNKILNQTIDQQLNQPLNLKELGY